MIMIIMMMIMVMATILLIQNNFMNKYHSVHCKYLESVNNLEKPTYW